MIIVGLTGSIGMGKSETAKMFRAESIPVFDADAAVHTLQQKGGKALPLIDKAFPGAVIEGELNRPALGAQVFADLSKKKILENIMHPMVGEERIAFFEKAEKQKADIVVLDVPLLFETGGDKGCHYTVVVSAPAEVQRERVLNRPDMTTQKFEDILKRQTPDADKRRMADYIIETDKGLDHARNAVASIIADIRDK